MTGERRRPVILLVTNLSSFTLAQQVQGRGEVRVCAAATARTGQLGVEYATNYGTPHRMDAPFRRASDASLHSRDFCDLHEECGGGSGGMLDARMDALKGASNPQMHLFGTR